MIENSYALKTISEWKGTFSKWSGNKSLECNLPKKT